MQEDMLPLHASTPLSAKPEVLMTCHHLLCSCRQRHCYWRICWPCLPSTACVLSSCRGVGQLRACCVHATKQVPAARTLKHLSRCASADSCAADGLYAGHVCLLQPCPRHPAVERSGCSEFVPIDFQFMGSTGEGPASGYVPDKVAQSQHA